jgi:hypothetical protein
MPATAVKTAWSGGNLYFYDKSGNVIFYIDGTNRSMVFASGSGLTAPTAIDATDIAAGAVTYDKVTITAGTVLAGTKTTDIASLVDISAEGAILAGQGAGETPAAVTLSGDVTMDETYTQICAWDPGGAGRTIKLPPENDGLWYLIANLANAAEDLTIQNDAAGAVGTINQSEAALCYCEGGTWYMPFTFTIALA